jgi:hypothetical protein
MRCISNPKVSLKRWRFEIILKPTSARANPSVTRHLPTVSKAFLPNVSFHLFALEIYSHRP